MDAGYNMLFDACGRLGIGSQALAGRYVLSVMTVVRKENSSGYGEKQIREELVPSK